MKNSKTALNMLGVSSPVKNDEEIRDVSELMENVEGYNPSSGKVMHGASGNLGLVGGIGKGIGKGIAKLFSKLVKNKKPFWPQTKNTGDLYARARARVSETTARPKANVPSKSSDPYSTFTPTELKRVQGMSTPLKPNLTPANPRGVETIEWAGGRKVVKPGTPGRGGNPTYSEKNPLWPTFEGTNIDKILYPKNWKM